MILLEVFLVVLLVAGLVACGVLLPLWELIETQGSARPSRGRGGGGVE